MEDNQIDLDNLKTQAQRCDYVWFTMIDLHGIPRGKLIPSRHAGNMLDNGMGMYSGYLSLGPQSEENLVGIAKESNNGNVYAIPVVNTINMLTWAGSERAKIGEILCEPKDKNGTIVKANSRYVARKQIHTLETMGLKLMSAYEMEFFLTKAKKPLYESSHYCSTLKFNEVEGLMLELEHAMLQCGIDVECFHVEAGPGHFEITFRPRFGTQAADDMFFFKRATKEIARKYDIEASFMAKPHQMVTNACHFNHSLWSTENNINLFNDNNRKNEISQLGKYWIGGIIKHMDALTAICCPTINCYRLLHSSQCADKNDWDYESRHASLRVKTGGESSTYIENRIPTNACNFHLVMAATVAAGIDGINNQIEPPPSGKRSDSLMLPVNLEEALKALESDTALVEALGHDIVECFLTGKRNIEVAKFGHHDISGCNPAELESEKEEYFEVI